MVKLYNYQALDSKGQLITLLGAGLDTTFTKSGVVVEIAPVLIEGDQAIVIGDEPERHFKSDLIEVNAMQGSRNRQVKRFNTTTIADTKAGEAIEDDGRVIDYQDVRFGGMASVYDVLDLGGDIVKPGAFKGSLETFRKNPVCYVEHCASALALAGHWDKLEERAKGLYAEAAITNSPKEDMRHVRFLIKEGSLKGLSIGGFWHYEPDYVEIFRADLLEISIVSMPMNQESLGRSKSLGSEDVQALQALHRVAT